MDTRNEMDRPLTVGTFARDKNLWNPGLSSILFDTGNECIDLCLELRQWYETFRVQGNDE